MAQISCLFAGCAQKNTMAAQSCNLDIMVADRHSKVQFFGFQGNHKVVQQEIMVLARHGKLISFKVPSPRIPAKCRRPAADYMFNQCLHKTT